MVEEPKKEEKKCESKSTLSTIVKVLLGLVFLVLGVLAILNWLGDLLSVIKGCVGPFLVLAAVITFAIAKE